MLDNYRVQVFRAVAEQASFRRAAEQLHLSQPSVSQHVRQLEEELGVKLLERGASGVEITPAGEVVLGFARKASRLSHDAMAALATLEGKPGGDLKLAASTTVAQYVLPAILGRFSRENPRVRLNLRSGNTERVVSWIATGEAELGIIEGPADRKEIFTERFLEDRLVLVVAREHPWSKSQLVDLETLAAAPMLMREQGSGTRRVLERALKKAGLRLGQLRIAMELDSTEAIVAGVEAGLGVGFVSEWAIRKELRLGTLAVANVAGLDVRRWFSFVRMHGPAPAGAAGAFRSFALNQAEILGSRLKGRTSTRL